MGQGGRYHHLKICMCSSPLRIWCIFMMCCLRLEFCANFFPQSAHSNGRSPLCTPLWCLRRFYRKVKISLFCYIYITGKEGRRHTDACAKLWPQPGKSQTWGLVPTWHLGQKKWLTTKCVESSSPMCEFRCSFKDALCAKLFLQSSKEHTYGFSFVWTRICCARFCSYHRKETTC